MPVSTKVIPVRLEKKLYDRVVAEAKLEGRSISNYVQQLVLSALKK